MSIGDMVLDFGKYRGKKLSQVPGEYLDWLCDLERNPKGVVIHGTNWSELAHQYWQEQKRQKAAQPKPVKPSRFADPDFRRKAAEIEPVTVDGVTYTLMCNYGLEKPYWTFAVRNEQGEIVPTGVGNNLYGDEYKTIRSWIVDDNKSVPDSFYH